MALIDEYLVAIQTKSRAANTIRSYLADLQQFSEFAPLETATRDDVMKLLQYLKNHNYGSASILRKMSVLRCFYKWMKATGKRLDSPVVELPELEKPVQKPVAATEEDIQTLLKVSENGTTFGSRDAAMIRLIFDCGLRASEIVALNRGDISDGKVNIPGNRARSIVMSKETADAIYQYLINADVANSIIKSHDTSATAPLFMNKLGGRLSDRSMRRKMGHYLTEAGLDKNISPKSIRHAFANRLIENGEDTNSVKDKLGLKGSGKFLAPVAM